MPPPPDDLVRLLAAVASGDRRAFADLYGRVAPKLFAVILRIVRDRALAEDILQETFLKVWSGAGSFLPEAGRPMTWMISVARNRAIDAVRARRPLVLAGEGAGSEALDVVPDGRDREAEFVAADSLSRCLGELDAIQRACILGAYLDGYSREELAERYERPVNTIKTWLHRSALQVRRCLDGQP